MGAEQQVLRRHGGTLHRHQELGLSPLRIRIDVGMFERQADQDQHRRAGDARI